MVTTAEFMFDPAKLSSLAEQYREEYANAEPFPHIQLDNFLPEYILNEILDEFPDPNLIRWQKFENSAEKKLASTDENQMGKATRQFLYQLNSSTFVGFLEKLTGISGIIPDPHFVGGGLHQIERGGYLKMHVDFNHHNRLKLDRRLNLLIYLNKDWQEEYGGHLELWDANMTHCVKKILPVFNRLVVFSTTDFSYHGHPVPLTCPEGRTRKSLALYYYSNGRPSEEIADSPDHSTIFKTRPGEENVLKTLPSEQSSVKDVIKKVIPPIVLEVLGKKSTDTSKN